MGGLATPKSVQKLQTALHAKAKAEAGYRFYALYDKISREDILVHAYAHYQAVVYDLLLKVAAETLITIAADPKHLGARIGLTAVLHTWGSALTQNPHS